MVWIEDNQKKDGKRNAGSRKLNIMLERKPINYAVDADIKGFFNILTMNGLYVL